MPEYWIIAVRYLPHGPIEQVKVFQVSVTNYPVATYSRGADQYFTRDTVVAWLTNKYATVFTATATPGGGWQRGAQVQVTADGHFLTSQGNDWIRDNLASLPRF